MTIDDNLGASTDVRSSGVGRAQDVGQQQSTREKAALSREDSASLSALGTGLARAFATASPGGEKSGLDRGRRMPVLTRLLCFFQRACDQRFGHFAGGDGEVSALHRLLELRDPADFIWRIGRDRSSKPGPQRG